MIPQYAKSFQGHDGEPAQPKPLPTEPDGGHTALKDPLPQVVGSG